MEADGDGEKSSFRWIDAARYVVAAVVAVLIVAVIVNAIKEVLRPESLYFSVTGGSVFVTRIQPPPAPKVVFNLKLRAENPAGRARLYFVDIKGYLFDKNVSAASLHPDDDSVFFFAVKDKAVQQHAGVDAFINVKAEKKYIEPSYYFDELYYSKGSTISDVTLRLDGTLITEVRSSFNATSRNTTYYCRPLLVGGEPDDESFANRSDVLCIKV